MNMKSDQLQQRMSQANQGGVQAQGQQDPAKRVDSMLKKMEAQIKRALPESLGLTPDRFARVALTTIRQNPTLLQCTDVSLMAALMQSAQLGLDPSTNLGQAYLVPRRNKDVWEAQFQLGYKGYMQLIRRSGEVAKVEAHVVYKEDEFDFQYGDDPRIHHKPTMKAERGAVVAYYVIVFFKNGEKQFHAMSREQVIAHAKKYSKQIKEGRLTGVWAENGDNFDGMALKTVFLQMKNWLPLSVDVMEKLETDGSVKTELSAEMTTIPSVVVDQDTGEIIEAEFQATHAETATTQENQIDN